MATTITANGINFPDGSAGSPSIGGTDTNTGLFTGSDIIGFSTGGSERLRVDSSGRLLLGTTTEGVGGADNLTIAGSGDSGMTIRSGTSSTGGLYFSDGTSGADEYRGVISYNQASNYMRFYTDASERLRIDSSGNMLMGSTTAAISAGKGLMIADAAGARIKLCDSDQGVDAASGFEIIASNGGTAYVYNRENQAIVFGTNNTEVMRITHEGSVGIGVTNSTYELEIHDSSGAAALRLKDGANNVITDLIADSTGGHLRTTYNHPFRFSTNQVERMRIDTSGNVGIGVTPTMAAGGGLHVRGPSGHQARLHMTTSNSGDTGNDGFYIIQQGAESSNNDTNFINYETANMKFSTAGTERLRVQSGGGISFNGDTAAANALDDYEEGDWTPVFQGTTTTGSVTYTARVGKYVKIGKVVTWEFYIAFNSGNGAGTFHITGLPFTVANNGTYPAVNIGYVHSITLRSDYYLTGLHASNNNYIYFYERPNGGGSNVQPNYDGAGSLIMSGHYEVV